MNYFIARKERKHGTSLHERQGRAIYTRQYRSRMHGLAISHSNQYNPSIPSEVGFKIQAMESGQNTKDYILNEQQATLLVTFLKNTEQVANFKTNLV